MPVAVGDIVELVRPDGAVGFTFRQRRGEPLGIAHVVVWILVWDSRHLYELGAEQPQRALLLDRLGLGDDDDGAVTESVADHRQADAGIAGSPLDDGAAGAQLSAPDRLLDDEKGGAILDRLSGIHELGLAEDGRARRLGSALQAYQRCVADGGGDVGGMRQGRKLHSKDRPKANVSTLDPQARPVRSVKQAARVRNPYSP